MLTRRLSEEYSLMLMLRPKPRLKRDGAEENGLSLSAMEDEAGQGEVSVCVEGGVERLVDGW